MLAFVSQISTQSSTFPVDHLNNSCNHIKDSEFKSQIMNQKPSTSVEAEADMS